MNHNKSVIMKKAPISVRIIEVLTTISFWIMVGLTVVVFFANVLFMTGVINEEFQLRVMLPVTFTLESMGTMPMMNEVHDVKIEEASGKLYIVDTPMAFTKIVSKVLFVVVAIGLFMVWKFKRFINNIRSGRIFDKGNIDNLKHISLTLVLLFFVSKIYMAVFYQTTVRLIEVPNVTFSSEFINTDPLISVALLLWVLAYAFQKGYELQEENDLMV